MVVVLYIGFVDRLFPGINALNFLNGLVISYDLLVLFVIGLCLSSCL
jgi:hypothetical protein